MAPEKAAALCELFRDRELLELDGQPAVTWRFTPARAVVPPAALLRGVREELSLGIARDDLRQRLGEREWWDYDGESRLLAWTLAHDLLMEGLGQLLGERLTLVAFNETALPLADVLTISVLAFSVTGGDGRTTTGTLSLSPAMVSRLAAHAGWRKPANVIGPWKRLPACLRIELRGIRFPRSELADAGIGDVLVLGRRARCWSNLQVAVVAARSDTRLQAWSAVYERGRFTIGAAALNVTMEGIMPEQSAEDPNDAAAAGALAAVPVALDFDLGGVSLPLAELAALKPGYVFKLPGRLEEVRVLIRANGVKVGRGELVAVDDVLGVQLLAVETDGLR
jgi:type III secretion protein Q